MVAIEFGGPIENLSEGHRPELIVHFIPCGRRGRVALRRHSRMVAPGKNLGSGASRFLNSWVRIFGARTLPRKRSTGRRFAATDSVEGWSLGGGA